MIEKIRKFLRDKESNSGIINTSEIILHEEVIKMCESNRCGNYNKSWTCPPAAGELKEILCKINAFNKAYVFSTKYNIEDSFDFEGMQESAKAHEELTHGLYEELGKNVLVFGAGGCRLCIKCNYPDPCRNPDKIFPSLEASGILVSELAKSAGLTYNNGENTVTFFAMVLYNG